MLTVCREYQERIPLALFGDLDPDELRALQSHLKLCPACTEEYETLSATLNVIEDTKLPRPDPGMLDGLWEKLEPELDRTGVKGQPKPARILRFLSPHRPIESRRSGWVLPVAAAAALAVVIVIVARIPTGPDPLPPQAQMAALDETEERVGKFLSRSERVVMGISNLDPRRIERTGYDLSAERDAARKLAAEAEALRHDLGTGADRRLVALVGDLELIFLQVSNIRDRRVRTDLELAQAAVERRGVLFNMSFEEIRRTRGATVIKSSV